MSDENYQLLGLIGFVLSGVFFLISGIQAGDALTIAGSSAWMIACLGWAIPLMRARRAESEASETLEAGR